MHPEDEQVRRLLKTRVIRLNETVTGLSIGLIAGIGLFCATNLLVIKGGNVVGPHLELLNQVFIGYKVSFLGSFIGFAYALITGALVGYCGAKIYNFVASRNNRTSAPVKQD
ncbi:MAG TPA: hypothetical protein VHD56_07230 [Tepidisphaeraceae bacterium]|nr:hypothetical protein [Tepidisphaeraceae bacterium]